MLHSVIKKITIKNIVSYNAIIVAKEYVYSLDLETVSLKTVETGDLEFTK